MSKLAIALVLSFAGATAAQASNWVVHQHIPRTTTAPEIDPASALSGLTLFAGALAIIRGRRSKK